MNEIFAFCLVLLALALSLGQVRTDVFAFSSRSSSCKSLSCLCTTKNKKSWDEGEVLSLLLVNRDSSHTQTHRNTPRMKLPGSFDVFSVRRWCGNSRSEATTAKRGALGRDVFSCLENYANLEFPHHKHIMWVARHYFHPRTRIIRRNFIWRRFQLSRIKSRASARFQSFSLVHFDWAIKPAQESDKKQFAALRVN